MSILEECPEDTREVFIFPEYYWCKEFIGGLPFWI
jgi:hypothetical protein